MRRPFIFTSLGVVRGESKRGNRKCGPENSISRMSANKTVQSWIWIAHFNNRFNIFKLIFPQLTLGRLKPNFMWSLLGMRERMLVQIVYVTRPRWPPCPYMVNYFKHLLLWNLKADDLETWYAALRTQVLLCLFKLCYSVDLDLFYGKINLSPVCFCIGKIQIQYF